MYRIFILLFLVVICQPVIGQGWGELSDRANQLLKEEKLPEAMQFALKAKHASQKEFGNASKEYATTLNNLASVYRAMGNYTNAQLYYSQALSIRKPVLGEDHPAYARSLNNLAFIYQSQGNYPDAEKLLSEAIAIKKRLLGEKNASYATSLNNLAALYEQTGKYPAAISLYKQAAAIFKSVSGTIHPMYARCLNNLASVYISMGNYPDAETLLKQTLAIKKDVSGEANADYAASLHNFAGLYETIGDFRMALSLYNKASSIFRNVLGEEHPYYSTSLSGLASSYVKIGNYSGAELLCKQVLTIRKNVWGEEHPDYATSLNNLAALYRKIGNDAAAQPLYRKALSIKNKVLGNEHPSYAISLNNLASLYESTGYYTASEMMYLQVQAILKKNFGPVHPDYAESLKSLAFLYLRIDSYKKSEPLFKQILNIRKKTLGENHPDYAASLGDLGNLYYHAGNFVAAELWLNQALAIRKKVLGEEHPDYATSLNNLAVLNETTGNYVLASAYLIKGTNLTFTHIGRNLSTLSEEEKLKWWEKSRDNFTYAPCLLFTAPNLSNSFLQQACTQQLQLKGFVLNDAAKVLNEARKSGSPQLQQLLTQWQTSKATLAKQYTLPTAERIPQLNSLEQQTNELEKQISQQSTAFRATQQNQHIGFEEVQQQLKPREAAIEFIRFHYYHKRRTDSTFYAAFVILPNDALPHFVPLCEEKQLAALLEIEANSSAEYVEQLYRDAFVSTNEQADSKVNGLYNLVWKPLLPWLKGITKIHLAPAGLLSRIAFPALPIDSSTLLIDKYQLRQYSSVRQIAEKQVPASKTNTITSAVLYGGIDFSTAESTTAPNNETVSTTLPDAVRRSIRGGVWTSLPGTLQEVNSIRGLFKSNRITTRVITGSAATEESLKQLSGHSPAILHLATHGFSLPNAQKKRKDNLNSSDNAFTLAENPLLRSGIVLAGANRVWSGAASVAGKEDGILTAYEISNLDLGNTELVVLSACETALGDIRGTEGVFGLQRAFKLAGVQSMILSLWQVPDKETAELMGLLYTNKLKGATTYEAFNKAQDTMRKIYPPYFWAAFVLIE